MKREKGKIARSEWAQIADRRLSGESLTSIANGYHCTPAAIRYIVTQSSKLFDTKASEPIVERTGARIERKPTAAQPPVLGGMTGAVDRALFDRIHSEMAGFMSALDAAVAENSDDNRKMLLTATDRLLRATSRIRIELERGPLEGELDAKASNVQRPIARRR